jgi:hypothetical protein
VPMLVGVGLILSHQLTGLPAMLYYIVEIFEEVAPRLHSFSFVLYCTKMYLNSNETLYKLCELIFVVVVTISFFNKQI